MKKHPKANLLLLPLVACAVSVQAGETLLVQEGAPRASIYVCNDEETAAPLDLKALKAQGIQRETYGKIVFATALNDLESCLKTMTGALLPVKKANGIDDVRPPAVVVGKLADEANLTIPAQAFGESFAIRAKDGMVVLAGKGYLGRAYAIWAFLNRLGCEWVMPGTVGEIIPLQKTVVFPDDDWTESPSFDVRLWDKGKGDIDTALWALRNRQQLIQLHPKQWTSSTHVWGAITTKYKDRFMADKSMYALVNKGNGVFERSGPQLETTHPGAIQAAVDYVDWQFQKNGWADDATVCVGMGPADGSIQANSLESQMASAGRIDTWSGTRDGTDLLVNFLNKILAATQKKHPNMVLGFYLYSDHADYPVRYVPDPRISVIIADISQSRLHGANDPVSKSRSHYRRVIEQWGELARKQGNPLFFRGYNWNLADNILPFTKIKIWGEDIPYYHRLGIIGFAVEHAQEWALLASTDFMEAKLTWNANAPWKDVLSQFCRSSYGDASPQMEKYFLSLADRQSSAGMEAGSYHSAPLIYNDDFIAQSEALFDEARLNAKLPEEQRRINLTAFAMGTMKSFFAYRKALAQFDFKKAKALYDELVERHESLRNENQLFVSKGAVAYLNRFLKGSTESALQYSSGDYGIAWKVPEQLKTAFDGNCSGEKLNYYGPCINDSGYVVTHTWSSTWDAQGLSGLRSGSAWYRMTLRPQPFRQSPGLFVGGVDNQVKVWCNGVYIGEGRGFMRPFAFDLTNILKADTDNSLVLEVIRNGNSELGTGGIIFPCFVFDGPRLEQKSPEVKEFEVMLPGAGNVRAN